MNGEGSLETESGQSTLLRDARSKCSEYPMFEGNAPGNQEEKRVRLMQKSLLTAPPRGEEKEKSALEKMKARQAGSKSFSAPSGGKLKSSQTPQKNPMKKESSEDRNRAFRNPMADADDSIDGNGDASPWGIVPEILASRAGEAQTEMFKVWSTSQKKIGEEYQETAREARMRIALEMMDVQNRKFIKLACCAVSLAFSSIL